MSKENTSRVPAVLAVFPDSGTLTVNSVHRRFNETGCDVLANRVARAEWIAHWTGQLVERGRLTRRRGGRLCRPLDPVEAAAA